MNVSLTQKIAAYVEREVANGDYASASELVRDALRLHERNSEDYAAKLAAMKAAVNEGIRAIDEGQYVEYSDQLIDEILAETLASTVY